ncbi:hypothetical protein ABZ357_09720 [Streptomyces sp. NPDC005917]|uniref:hypothetical protein n=1 Tax=unclassified Streptomyces TaxID=2593676 RepID=UPI0033DDC91A
MTTDAATPERNPFLEAVGRVTVAGAHLDRYLHTLLGSLAMEPTLLVLANAEGTARLIELCELALKCYDHNAEDVTDVKDCLARAKVLKGKRNTIVHSLFMQAEEGDGFKAMTPVRKTLGHSATPFTVEEMEAVAKEIDALLHDLFRAGWNLRSRLTGMRHIPLQAEPAEVPRSGT